VKIIVPALLVSAVLAGCGTPAPAPVAYDPAAYAATVCVDRANWVRVPDNYCPLDDAVYPDHPFMWVYDEYREADLDVDVVYVGYPVERTRYVDVRPQRVATVNLDRGRFPEKATAGAAGTTVRMPSMPMDRRTPSTSPVRRGGLGVPSARASNVPAPSRNLDSPAPGRAPAAGKQAPVPPPRATPPRASGPRPVTSGSATRTGRR